MTVKELDEKYQETLAKHQKLIAEQKEADRKAQEYNELAETAAAAGELMEYKDHKLKANDAESLSYVLGKQIKRITDEPIFTADEVADAWRRYSADYNRQFAGKRKKFDKLKTELLEAYADMVQFQRDACAARERIGGYIGVKRNGTAIEPDADFDQRFEMDVLPHEKGLSYIRGANTDDADLVYYLANIGISDALELSRNYDAQNAVQVVRFHKA